MEFQLVLQWPASSLDDYDEIVEIEEMLLSKLGEEHEVDGHDAGSGEVNIFIRCKDPHATFEAVRSILQNEFHWSAVRVGYRNIEETKYRAVWPNGLTNFEVN